MSLSKALYLALIVAVSHADAVPPTPSAYPLSEPCVHEWQYLNFNPNNATDKAHLEKLHDVICGAELRAVLSYGELAAKDFLPPYTRYFPSGDNEFNGNPQDLVVNALHIISGGDVGDGAIGTVVETLVVDNLDFANDCIDGFFTFAYTLTDELDGREKIHFCDNAWTLGSAYDVDCASLDPFPSTKMDAFSRIVIEEIVQSSSVVSTFSDTTFADVVNADGVPTFDPTRVHGLLDPAQDDMGYLAADNAGSYAWMSLDAYISGKCGQGSDWSNFFTQDPPPYVVLE